MKKWQYISTIGFASMLLLTACGEEDAKTTTESSEVTTETSQETAQFPVTLTDAIGKEVTLEKTPERIVSLIPSNT